MLHALCGLLYKVALPDLLDPIHQISEFIEKGHLVEVVIQ